MNAERYKKDPVDHYELIVDKTLRYACIDLDDDLVKAAPLSVIKKLCGFESGLDRIEGAN